MQNNEYVTKDLGIAAMLIATGHTMRTMNWKDRVAYFTFDSDEECNQKAHLFLFGKIMVDARTYHEAERVLKAQIVKYINKGGEYKHGRSRSNTNWRHR